MKRCMASSDAFIIVAKWLASAMRSGLPITGPRRGRFEQTGPLVWRVLGMTGDVTGHGRRWHNVGSDPLKDVYDQYDRMLNFLRLDLNLSIVIDSLRHDLRRRDGRDRRSDGCAGAAARAPVAAWFSWRRDEAIPVSPEQRRRQRGERRAVRLPSPRLRLDERPVWGDQKMRIMESWRSAPRWVDVRHPLRIFHRHTFRRSPIRATPASS